MECKICGRYFHPKKTFANLFSLKKEYICDNCYKKYPLKINNIVLPLKDKQLIIYSLYENLEKKYYNYFSYEYGIIAGKLFQEDKNLLLVDTFSENDLEFYEMLGLFFDRDLKIICFSLTQIS